MLRIIHLLLKNIVKNFCEHQFSLELVRLSCTHLPIFCPFHNSLLSERLPESSKESIKAVSRSPGPNSEGGVQNMSVFIMFVL